MSTPVAVGLAKEDYLSTFLARFSEAQWSTKDMLCTICNQFQGRWPIDSRAENQHRGEGIRSLIVPRFTWDELLASAKLCYCCGAIASGCRGVFNQRGIDELEILHGSIRFYYPPHTEDVDEADCDKHLIFYLTNGLRFEVEIFGTEDDDCPIPDGWDYFATLRRTSPRTDSPEALVTIKIWIEECLYNHRDSFCDALEDPELPKRVVDVGLDDGIVKLVETMGANLKAKYICLSHCWGLTQIITTTEVTLAERKKGIVWHDLSKTFQDAISMTRTLGFRYIWIDSLCIIQDSAEDWAIESAKMASVYSNGHLTIAGTGSPNGAGGLFSSTPDFEVSGISPEGEEYRLFFRERIDHQIDMMLEGSDTISTETYYPLLSRAWVYQERMLSTRVLHFGRYELFFECKSAIQCECEAISFHGAGLESPIALIKIEYAEALWAYLNSHKRKYSVDAQYQGARLWRTMVCCYTALRLTKTKDRLPACGGLARQMATHRQSKYLAGLWEESLLDDLLWMVYTTSKLQKPRPKPRNAPTWSWASVETTSGVDYWDAIAFTDVAGNASEERRPCKHFARIEKCEVTSSGVDEFGAIAHGTLGISGLVAEGVLEREVALHSGEEEIRHYVSFSDVRLSIRPDYLLDHEGEGHSPPGTPVFGLRLSMRQLGRKDCLVSLILKQSVGLPDCFERIGTLQVLGDIGSVNPDGGIFQSAELRTVVII